MSPCTCFKRQRGMTLLEVLIATFLTTVGLMSAFYMVGASTAINMDARNMSLAHQAAAQELEILRNMPYETLQPMQRTGANPESRFVKPNGTDDASRPGDMGYAAVLTPALKDLPGGGTGGLVVSNDAVAGDKCKRVTVVVRWKDRGNENRVVTVNTSIAKGGINVR